MDELGLSQVIKEMLSEDKGFRTTISNAAKDFSPQLMADLLTRGWGKWIAPRHLSGELGARYAEVIMGLSEEEAVAFSEVFEKPPVDNERFISEHGLKGADRSRPLSIAREALLNNPGLAGDPSGINDIVGEILSNKISTAAINNLPKKLASRLTLGDLVEVGDDLENPDFYFQRQGSADSIGSVKESLDKVTGSWWGVRVKEEAKEMILPKYLYYSLMHIKNGGYWKSIAKGTTNLQSIRKGDLLSLPIG
jgi:hypothetical protein